MLLERGENREENNMGCEICGRSDCTRSFHSLEEQEEFDTKTGRYAPDDPDDEVNDDGDNLSLLFPREEKISVVTLCHTMAGIKNEVYSQWL